MDEDGMATRMNHHSGDEDYGRTLQTDSTNYKSSNSKKRRIVYSKDFLVKCFKHPAAAKRPHGFPLSNVDCTLANPRLIGNIPLVTSVLPMPVPKKKEESMKKEPVKKESDLPNDSISLRPQRATFSSGCAPNLSPNLGRNPLNMETHNRSFTERDSLQMRTNSNSRFGFNNQRTWNNDNVVKTRETAENHHKEKMERERERAQERDREEREKDRDQRDRRDRDREQRDRDRDLRDRDRIFQNYEQRERESQRDRDRDRNRTEKTSGSGKPRKEFFPSHLTSGWGAEPEPDWNRRRNGDRTERGQNNSSQDQNRSYSSRSGPNYRADEEPEWFNVPMSHNDTIELCGLPGDDREGTKTERKEKLSNGAQYTDSGLDELVSSQKSRKIDFSHINVGMAMSEEEIESKLTSASATSSRFTNLFANQNHEENRASTEPKEEQIKYHGEDEDVVVVKLGNKLRDILLHNHEHSNQSQSEPNILNQLQTRKAETPQPPAEQTHIQYNILSQLQGRTVETSQPHSNQGDQLSFGQILDQLVEKGSARQTTTLLDQHQISENIHESMVMCLPRSRPGSSPSTVSEIYSDPLHPFTKLVREIHNGLPMSISEFIPRDVAPINTNPLMEQHFARAITVEDQRRLDEEQWHMKDRQFRSLAAQEYRESMQQQARANGLDIQMPQRAFQMEPSQEFEHRSNGSIAAPQPIFQGQQHAFIANGPIHPTQQIQQNGPPISTYNHLPASFGPPAPPMNLYTEQIQNNHRHEFTPAQVMSYLPYDLQMLVSNSTISPEVLNRPEVVKCLNGIKSGEITLHDIICQINSPIVAQRHTMAIILKFCFQGLIRLNGLLLHPVHAPYGMAVGPVPMNPMPMTVPRPQMIAMPMMQHPHSFPQFSRGIPLPMPPAFYRGFHEMHPSTSGPGPMHGNFHQAPVTAHQPIPMVSVGMSSMAFTPTAVMRQMTAGSESRATASTTEHGNQNSSE